MRKYVILLVLTVFFAGITYYLLQTLNPFNLDEVQILIDAEEIEVKEEFISVLLELKERGLIFDYLNHRNVLMVSVTAGLSILCGFVVIHSVIDRLFFKKFYQHSSFTTAIRRGVILLLAIGSMILYDLYAAPWYLSLMTIILLLIIELMVWKVLQPAWPEDSETEEGEEVPVQEQNRLVKEWQKIRKGFNKQISKIRSRLKAKDPS